MIELKNLKTSVFKPGFTNEIGWICKDKENYCQNRLNVIAKHRKFFSIKPIKTLILGPLTDKTGDLMKGSFLMVVASSKNEIKLFQV